MYNIEGALDELFTKLTSADIKLDGLFINADAGFDSKGFREACFRNGVFANVDFNIKNGEPLILMGLIRKDKAETSQHKENPKKQE